MARSDHPIGTLFPFDIVEQPGVDLFKPELGYTNASGNGKMAVFDINGNGGPDLAYTTPAKVTKSSAHLVMIRMAYHYKTY